VLAPLLSKKLRARDFALLLLLACIGNLIGTYALALLSIAAVPAAKLETLRAVMKAKLDAPYFAVFCSAILCNLSVCIGVLTSLKSKPFIDKLAVAFPMAMFFVACGFEHIVADFYYAAVYGIQYTVPFLGVVLAGNLIGGMAVACYARFS
jgi:formate/nitrite transporter FocA (FNT family)